MKRFIIILSVLALLGSASLGMARDANRDALSQAWNQQQVYQGRQGMSVWGPGIQWGSPKGYHYYRHYQPSPYDNPRIWEPAP